MNATIEPTESTSPPSAANFRIANKKMSVVDRITDLVSDRLSPILVKETRQSLKSRQFFWTFFILLVSVLVWTIIGLAGHDPTIEFGTTGASLLTGYWLILGIPLAVVIPYSAFRSLSKEYEDGTIQLVSATTMKSWQIVAGKLGSAMLQMIVYVSVLAPCIAFTYLLRGLSIPQIAIGMLYCVTGCFALTCISLMFAGANTSRLFGAGISIVLLLIQIVAWICWSIFAGSLAFGDAVFVASSDGAFISFGIVSVFLTTGLLMFASASSLISFEADNRSTLVRLAMLLQQFLLITLSVCWMTALNDVDQIFMCAICTSHYWFIMGLVLIGEREGMSTRVKRSIPKTILGRAFTAFFFPGSGRGLLFALSNMWFCVFMFTAIHLIVPWLPEASTGFDYLVRPGVGGDWDSRVRVCIAACLGALYPSCYLAFMYLFCHWLRKHGRKVSGFFTLFVGVLLVITVSGIVLLVHNNIVSDRNWRFYSLEQTLNWHWTAAEFLESGFAMRNLMGVFTVAMGMSAICIVAIWVAARELRQQHVSTPERVIEENLRMQKFDRPPPGETIDDIFANTTEDS